MTAAGEKQKRFTPEQVVFIREVKDFAMATKLARKLGVNRETIYRIWNEETYRDVVGVDARVSA